jgi:hypothetical protein
MIIFFIFPKNNENNINFKVNQNLNLNLTQFFGIIFNDKIFDKNITF